MKPTRTFDLLDRYLSLFPDKCALACKKDGRWIEYTGSEYSKISSSFAAGLLSLGMKRGDRIVTITANRPEWNFIDMGMSMVGMVHVPVYTSLTDTEYRYIIEHCGASMVIVSDRSFYERLKPVCDSIGADKLVYTIDEVDDAANWYSLVEAGDIADDNIRRERETIRESITPDDLASVIYTSGTTGQPKGVMLSHSNLVSNFIAAAEVFGLNEEDRFLSILPLCHVGGRLGNYQTQYSGASIYYAENMGTIAANLKEIGATGFDAVPRILEKIYDNVLAKGRALGGMKKKIFFWAVSLGLRYKPFGAKGPFYYLKLKIADRLIFSKWRDALGGKVKLVGCGGAALQPRIERIFWAAGIKILNMYGLTETSPIITINRQTRGLCMLGSVGALIDGVELRIADDGEIMCRGHNVMMGYYRDEQLTKEVLSDDGWFRTGDTGRIEKGKFLMITDRKKEIFKLSSGKFVAPQLLENRLKESAYIDQAMVLGEHQKFAAALIVPDHGALQEFCRLSGINAGHKLEEMLKDESVGKLLASEVESINRTIADHERIRRFRTVTDQWSPGTGELSASLKLKRREIENKYSNLIGEIFIKQADQWK